MPSAADATLLRILTGLACCSSEASPICPASLLPQQYNPPFFKTAALCALPNAADATLPAALAVFIAADGVTNWLAPIINVAAIKTDITFCFIFNLIPALLIKNNKLAPGSTQAQT